MTIRAARLFHVHQFAVLLLALVLVVGFGPFCEANAMAASAMPTAMAGCADSPAAPTDKGAPAECTMTACAALPVTLAVPIAPVIYAASLLPLPSVAQRHGLKPAPATPPPRSA